MTEQYQLDEFDRIAECRECAQVYVFQTLYERAAWQRTHFDGDHETSIDFYSQPKHPATTTPETTS